MDKQLRDRGILFRQYPAGQEQLDADNAGYHSHYTAARISRSHKASQAICLNLPQEPQTGSMMAAGLNGEPK
jgi:hypothetical protein